MSLISAVTTHVATAGVLVGAFGTMLALSGIAVLWSKAADNTVSRVRRPR